MWVLRGRYSAQAIVLREIFAGAVSAFLVLKFLGRLLSEWNILTNVYDAHLLVGAVADNPEFAHAAV